jgi:FMN phosphatase YigB (HAD superfamily)
MSGRKAAEHRHQCAQQLRPAVRLLRAEPVAVPAGQISFTDDSTDNVEAAERCGWNAVRYHAAADLDALIS